MSNKQNNEPAAVIVQSTVTFVNWLDGVGTVDVDTLYSAVLPDGKTLDDFYDAADLVDTVRGDAAALVIGEALGQSNEDGVSVAPWQAGGTTTGALSSTKEGMWCQYTTEATKALENALRDIVGRYGEDSSEDDGDLM